ncbi:MAG: outer membrane lipoprotein-sorting protein [Spirochaetota bacterium]
MLFHCNFFAFCEDFQSSPDAARSRDGKKLALTILVLLAALPILYAEPDFKKTLKELDNLNNFGDKDFSATYTIISEKPGEEPSATQAVMFRRDNKKQFAMIILKPAAKKGQGYLKMDDLVWFYDPESRKFSMSSLRENVQGSDAKNSDLNRNTLSEDYEVDKWEEGTLGKYQVYILDLKATNNEVSYPRQKLWVSKENNIVLKSENYSLSNRLVRTSVYPKYTNLGGKLVPSVMIFVDELKKGEQTKVTMEDASIAPLEDYFFTKSYLERVNR